MELQELNLPFHLKEEEKKIQVKHTEQKFFKIWTFASK
jgi:hypothetical protein